MTEPTAPRLLTFSDVLTMTQKVAEGREDYVYEPLGSSARLCVYVDPENKPSCIVGHVFADDLTDLRIGYDSSANISGVGILLKDTLAGRYEVTARALHFLTIVQMGQDTGQPWGKAITLAQDIYGEQMDDTVAVDPYLYDI